MDAPPAGEESMKELALESLTHYLANDLDEASESTVVAAKYMRTAQRRVVNSIQQCHKTIDDAESEPAAGSTKPLRDRVDAVTARARRVAYVLDRIGSKLSYLESKYGTFKADKTEEGAAGGGGGDTAPAEDAEGSS